MLKTTIKEILINVGTYLFSHNHDTKLTMIDDITKN